MQYKIPQNVQIEDKIVGPLTLKQLIICGVGGGLTYVIYLSLAKVYFIEVWIGPVAILGLLTLALAFLKIHDIPFLKYILLIIEYSRNIQKRKWMSMGSTVKVLTMPRPVQEQKSKKEKIAEKTITSLSDVSRLLDHNTFEHVKTKFDSSIDNISDDYLLQKTFLGRDEKDIDVHHERLNQIAKGKQTIQKDGEQVVHMDDLKKGNVEVQLPRKN